MMLRTTTRHHCYAAALSLQAPRPFLSEKNKDFPFGPNDQADLKIGICFRHREFSVNTVILPGKILHIYSIHGQEQSNNESRSWHINKKIRFSRMPLLSRSSSETNSHDMGLNKSLLVLVFYFRQFCQF